MTLTGLVVKEMARRRLGLILSILAAVVATAAYVAVQTLSVNAQDTLRRSIFKMGHNILIVPRDASLDPLSPGFGKDTVPERLVDTLAGAPDLPAGHLVAMYQRRITEDSVLAILTGVRTAARAGEEPTEDSPAFDVADPHEAYLGAEAAVGLRDIHEQTVSVGSEITVSGRRFVVGRILGRKGNDDDNRVYVNLRAMQGMCGDPGGINAIAALGSVRPGVAASMQEVKRHIEQVVGGTAQVIILRRRFESGDKSRRMLRTLGLAISATLLLLCGLGIALYIYNNVSDRRYEVAVLIALGYRPRQVLAALMSQVMVVGVAAGIGGLVVGTVVAVNAGSAIVAVESVRPQWGLWWQALVFAFGLCVAAGAVAVWGALRAAPAEVLRNQ